MVYSGLPNRHRSYDFGYVGPKGAGCPRVDDVAMLGLLGLTFPGVCKGLIELNLKSMKNSCFLGAIEGLRAILLRTFGVQGH